MDDDQAERGGWLTTVVGVVVFGASAVMRRITLLEVWNVLVMLMEGLVKIILSQRE